MANMEKLINALLNDDHGISENAYNALVVVLEHLALAQHTTFGHEAKQLLAQVKLAEATDGRFYFPYHGEDE